METLGSQSPSFRALFLCVFGLAVLCGQIASHPGLCPTGCTCVDSTHVRCYGNGLLNFPAPIAETAEEIDVTGNHISNLNRFYGQMIPNLRRLRLPRNSLANLPTRAFTQHSIDIAKNHLQSIPSLSPSPEYLYLSSNNISRLLRDDLRLLVNLRKLVLDNNSLAEIGENALDSLDNLESFKARGCKLQQLHSRTFSSLNRLVYIHLDNNDLSHIYEHAFYRLTELRNVTLDNNNILLIDDNAFDEQSSLALRKLTLNFNQLGRDVGVEDRPSDVKSYIKKKNWDIGGSLYTTREMIPSVSVIETSVLKVPSLRALFICVFGLAVLCGQADSSHANPCPAAYTCAEL
ncbi:LGR4 [Branchiostoma lanceolatum]|uniref:LGR4 protein n=1 Tax=Branchiostoma lanceolatum TaxID=7740 RepID=A0A8K0EA13_BRALA|nr:LGR4 [Branchiostoma lanceolatum]